MAHGLINTRTLLVMIKVIMSIILSVIFYVLVVIAISKLCTVSYNFMYQIFGDVPAAEAPGTDVEMTINDGESTLSVASKLEYNKVIVNKYSFYIRAQLTAAGEAGTPIIPGTYELNTSMNYAEILSIITDYASEERKVEAK